MHRFPLLLLAASLSACSSNEKWADNAVTPALETMAEAPGDWSKLDGMIGRRPSESGLIDTSAISVDLNARLGASAKPYRNAMMAAGPLTRRGNFLVAEAPDAWLVLDPVGHAFRAGLRRDGQFEEWTTAGAEVPRPS
ncbi:hypothetical protein GGQ97_000266 [Sphingomonas kaistensis]|uniref:Lipoprotein n=1 Tax=Sphingomonas kaistensis TaxID=298708 RepID=A0A7X5Y4C1_9SPHN|nr:hypothetical protein [Sphingomonas kaistensis]NJC04473.1 hypothetical protein [Sphingomonas kaistensis]